MHALTNVVGGSGRRALRLAAPVALACAMTWLSPALPAAEPSSAPDLTPTQAYLTGLKTKEMMDVIDIDHDGVISREEWAAYQERVFDALDKKKTGFLEPSEFISTANDNVIPFATLGYSRGLMTESMFNKIDANHDGRISKKEFVDYQLMIFDRMDTQKQQKIEVAEFINQKPRG
jgi:Ca2+-binding EF-hand superfamily protein